MIIPTILEKHSNKEYAFDIYSRLLQDRIILLNGEINDSNDTMNFVKSNVSTICIGICASMAAFLLSSGETGKRFCLSNSEVMIHQPLGGAQGQATEIKIAAERILKLKKKINQILAKNTKQDIKRIEQDTERDYYLDSKEALEYGIIDNILT